MTPRISIIMPVLNGEKYIQEAIESILAQTYKNYELIVVDDGSTDNTWAKVEPYRTKMDLTYVRHPVRKGVTVTMNTGLRNASGEFIAFLDHDDAWLPEMLETQVAYLEQHPDVAMVHSDFQTIDPAGKVIHPSVAQYGGWPRPSGHVFPQLFMDNFIIGTSVLIRRECFDRLGFFDESLRFGDYHMWLRVARNYKVDYVPKVLTKYRQHASQTTRNVPAQPQSESVAYTVIERIVQLYPEIRNELGQRAINRRFASLYFDMAYSCFAQDAFANARPCLAKAIRLYPTNYKYYCYFLASFLPPSQARSLQRSWQKLRAFFAREGRFNQIANVTQS